MSVEASTRDVTISEDENIICGCTSTALAALRRRIAGNPTMTFEDLLKITGAGTKCTACLLDLEYHFVDLQSQYGGKPAVKDDEEDVSRSNVNLKQRIYRWLDAHSPMVPYPFVNTVPVLFGPDIEQWIWITNRSMLFEGDKCAPNMRIDLIIRDADGRVVATERKDVSAETTWRCNVSAPLLKATGGPRPGLPGAGSVEIRRRGMAAGIRGTTRPQLEIVTPKAACAVHSQAMSGPGQHWFACLYRPKDERMFFSMLNGIGSRQDIEITYPIGIHGIEPLVKTVTLPPNGTTLHELEMPEDMAARVGNNAVTISWRATSWHKLWAICASPNLDRFSIDHL